MVDERRHLLRRRQDVLDYDGDGCGDFQGLIHRIDHLAGLGVTCLWLMPFHPSPRDDDGYDVTDFYNVDPALGSLGDFAQLVRVARDRGLRVPRPAGDHRPRRQPHV